ncbi:immunoglobulin domain-containing protein [Opitutus terrae]|uniref:Immunoglobulin I-set domain protein n=1 Tax=Opitutus terrae (strain DSM 11246 / JCM 15787 / PB90-1) TaxID=452637 RepID=B1ZPT6_OPITP|nr:immunoglobulin domain-containing protein [Opitutus terrae]ACB75539.1 Immunoglobulin I-set domain protein [Opitutus terrae PB90-1]
MNIRAFAILPRSLVSICVVCLVASNIRAAVAPDTLALDPAFAPVLESTAGRTKSVISQPDGKLIVAGSFTRINGVSRNNLARLMKDGAVDPTFSPGIGPNGEISMTALQPDGHVIVVGGFTAFGTAARNGIARINLDGSLDTSFVPAKLTNSRDETLMDGVVAVQSDGRILVGRKQVWSGSGSMVRLAPDGSLDAAFSRNAADTPVHAIRVLSSGKILVAGRFDSYNGTPCKGIVRLNADGTVDPGFANSLPAGFYPVAMDVCPDGTVVLGAERSSTNLIRLALDGSVDQQFEPWGGSDRFVTSLAVQPDGRIIAAGSFGVVDGVEQRVVRLSTKGARDPSWEAPDAPQEPLAILLLKDNRVLVGGSSGMVDGVPRSGLQRLHADGSHDATFSAQVRAAGIVHAMVPRTDGKIAIGGQFNFVNGAPSEGLALLNADGTTADGFSASVSLVNVPLYSAAVRALALQPDGRLLVGGNFNRVNGEPHSYITRLQSGGSIDPTFSTGVGPNGPVNGISVQPDGQIVLGGNFSEFSGVFRSAIARISGTGALDPSFTPGTSGSVNTMLLDSSNRIFVGSFNGLKCILPDGRSGDTGLVQPIDSGSFVSAIAQGSDRKIYVEGLIDLNIWADGVMDLSGEKRNLGLVRLSSDGKVDGSFARIPASRIGGIGALCLQSDGSIIAGRAYNIGGWNTSTTGIARFSSAGSLDSSFRVLDLEDPGFTSMALLQDGRILASGSRFHDKITDQRGLARFAAPSRPSLTSPTTAVFVAGVETSLQLTATGCPAPTIELVSGTLPSWAAWHPDSGVISGTALAGAPETLLVFRAVNVAGQSSPRDLRLNVQARPRFTRQPQGAAIPVGGSVTLSAQGDGTPVPSFQWRRNGVDLPGQVAASLTLADMQPALAGVYTVVLSNSVASTESNPAVVGVDTAAKVVGAATEVGHDIPHSNGNVYDQVLLAGEAATITADPGQITRLSYLDLTDDIVQVEFSGAGSLTITLETPTGPARPVKYNQDVEYVKGHASLVLVGADETTNVGAFSVGRITASNPTLFRDDVSYDGYVDLRSIAIASSDGKFGGVRTANVVYSAEQGTVGIQAMGTSFTGPVYVADLQGSGSAEVVLLIGSATTIAVTGGDLFQSNAQVIRTDGIDELQFWPGSSSHGVLAPAQRNRAQLLQDGIDITDLIVVPPSQ